MLTMCLTVARLTDRSQCYQQQGSNLASTRCEIPLASPQTKQSASDDSQPLAEGGQGRYVRRVPKTVNRAACKSFFFLIPQDTFVADFNDIVSRIIDCHRLCTTLPQLCAPPALNPTKYFGQSTFDWVQFGALFSPLIFAWNNMSVKNRPHPPHPQKKSKKKPPKNPKTQKTTTKTPTKQHAFYINILDKPS